MKKSAIRCRDDNQPTEYYPAGRIVKISNAYLNGGPVKYTKAESLMAILHNDVYYKKRGFQLEVIKRMLDSTKNDQAHQKDAELLLPPIICKTQYLTVHY